MATLAVTLVRLFERVATVDDQYDIFDVGVQHADGGIDSMVVGGSFYSAKQGTQQDVDERRSPVTSQANLDTAQAVSTPGEVVDTSGAPVDVDGL